MSTEPGPGLSNETSFEKLREALGRIHEQSRQADAEIKEWVKHYGKVKKVIEVAKEVLKKPAQRGDETQSRETPAVATETPPPVDAATKPPPMPTGSARSQTQSASAESPQPETRWFYGTSGKPRGPLPEEELKSLLRAGELNQNTLVWNKSMSSWTRAAETHLIERKPLPEVDDLPPLPDVLPPQPATVFCVSCGEKLSPTAKFCGNCGQRR